VDPSLTSRNATRVSAQRKPLSVLRTLSGASYQVCSTNRRTALVKLSTATSSSSVPTPPTLVLVLPAGEKMSRTASGPSAGELVAVDEPVSDALPPDPRQDGAADDRERDQRRQSVGGQRHGAIEPRNRLKAMDDAQRERRPQPTGRLRRTRSRSKRRPQPSFDLAAARPGEGLG
jgi:hypothetical protein